ncbi:hypothetical protein ACFC1R_35325 [Kitasatospora sp. NPDC056138]|uniref:hypothetical protein n=1 Tax=Kitasatospora sp. NPDC056138 TaxID=3345724 RepID=UPI0035DBD7B1
MQGVALGFQLGQQFAAAGGQAAPEPAGDVAVALERAGAALHREKHRQQEFMLLRAVVHRGEDQGGDGWRGTKAL